MKRLILQLSLTVALFSVLTVLVLTGGGDEPPTFDVGKSDGEDTLLAEGEGYKCVGKHVAIIEKPDTVHASDEVFLRFKGESYTDYQVRVYYPSGLSESEDFSPRKADAFGRFGWDFTVPGNVSAGRLRITVMSEESYLLTDIEIVP
jgi:hypothetical protein